jgi:hypothetical protein
MIDHDVARGRIARNDAVAQILSRREGELIRQTQRSAAHDCHPELRERRSRGEGTQLGRRRENPRRLGRARSGHDGKIIEGHLASRVTRGAILCQSFLPSDPDVHHEAHEDTTHRNYHHEVHEGHEEKKSRAKHVLITVAGTQDARKMASEKMSELCVFAPWREISNRKFPVSLVFFVHFVVQIFFGKITDPSRKILERM